MPALLKHKIVGYFSMIVGTALLVPYFIASQGTPPPPVANLTPSSLSADLAPNGAPVDLTATLTNVGAGFLTWRVGQIRDASTGSAPAVAAGPIATARIYDKSSIDQLPFVPGEIIVAVKESVSSTSGVPSAKTPAPSSFVSGRYKIKRELIRAQRGKKSAAGILRKSAPPPRLGRKLYLVSTDDQSKAGMQSAIDQLRKDPNVVYAEPNFILKAINTPNDPDFNLQYGLHNSGQTGGIEDADIDAPEAWNTYTGDRNIVVGIIDTGIDYLHPDLVDNIWTNPGEVAGNGIDDDGNGYIDDIHGFDFVNNDPDPMDDHRHGTHVAGTIAASGNNGLGVVGVAWKAKLAALKFLDAGGSGSTSDAVEAIAYANAMDIPITNNSWGGGGFSQALKDVIDAGGERGLLFVAAAGNETANNDLHPHYPSSYESENILSVAATDHRDGLASFSSYGATSVDLGAPGVAIYSCGLNGTYRFSSGTSMASPHVAGAAALLKSFNPDIRYGEIKTALLSSVDPIPSLNGKVLSAGRLNLAKALQSLSPPWLAILPRGPGELAAGASQILTARVNPKGLRAGEHRALVQIVTNDPASPNRELEVIARVSACRSLTIDLSSLDFETVWRGTSRSRTLTLKNSCNDFTQLQTTNSTHKNFAVSTPMPLQIAPFGTATIEIVYSPDQVMTDIGTISFISDAEDNPRIDLSVQGVGIPPPSLSVNPSRFELTLEPSEKAIRKMLINNNGGDVLNLSLSLAAKPALKSMGAGKLIPGPTVAPGESFAQFFVQGKAPSFTQNLHPNFTSTATGLKVLYLNTLLPTDGVDAFITGLRALPNVDSLKVLSGVISTPDLAYLMNYDIVVVSANKSWSDARLLGNTLADYVDNGGGLCVLPGSFASGGRYTLAGRIIGSEYLPLKMGSRVSPSQTATEFASHPITDGVQSISSSVPIRTLETQGASFALGAFPDGTLVGAVNLDKPVIALNVFPSTGTWGGDFILMMANSLDFISGGGWIKVEPRIASIVPGGSMEFTLSLNSEKQLAGDLESNVQIKHNDPNEVNPHLIPVLVHVKPVKKLSLSQPKHDFGGQLVGGKLTTTLTLLNAGNQATMVLSMAATQPFSSNLLLPISVPAFSKIPVEILFEPKKEGFASGSVLFSSDAADNPSLTLALRGQGLPAPVVMLSPDNLTFNLNHNSAPKDMTSTLSNSGRGILHYKIGSPENLVSPTTRSLPKTVVNEKLYQAKNYDRPAVAGELLVGLKNGIGTMSNLAALSSQGISVKRTVIKATAPKGSEAFDISRKVLLVSVADASKAGIQKAIEQLRLDPNVAYAEPNYRLKAIAIPNDPDFNLLYGLHNEGQNDGVVDADIDAPEVWDSYTGAHNVIVGIIDTGIDYLHPDLVDNIWTNAGEIPGNKLDDDGNGYVDDVYGYDFANQDADPMDDHFHGTHVAGTVAASGNNAIGVVGVAWKAKLAALKFLDRSGSGTLDAAVEAIAYANAMGIPITSNSWGGGGFSQALKDVIDEGGERGYLFVAAAGNDYSDNDANPAYPASFDSENIISVAATNFRDELADFSNVGASTVDLGAPGVDIYSTNIGGGYRFLSGTSMATPHVSGAAALLKSFNTNLNATALKATLLASVDTIPALVGKVLSQGRLNVARAMKGTSPPWITINPIGAGQLAASASMPLKVTVNAKGMIAGSHTAMVKIATNDPKTPVKELNVKANVSGCRSLAVSSTNLAFGAVWMGFSRQMAVTLTNKCNDWTELYSVSISHKAFAMEESLPLRVPPFGMATLNFIYTPDDIGSDKALITLKSNAQDNATLKINMTGTGVKPPAIQVSKTSITESMDPSEQKNSEVKLTNKGGADLLMSVKVKVDRKREAAPNPSVLSLKAKSGKRYANAVANLSPKTLHPFIRSTAAELRVLYLSTMELYEGQDSDFMRGIRDLPQVAALDFLDGTVDVPNADYLMGYDIVIVSADRDWADSPTLGDAIADYVDQGGKVCLMVAAIALDGGYELQGRISTPDYLPMVKEGGGEWSVATVFEDHPITQGLTSIECGFPTASTMTQGEGLPLGFYDTGILLGAVNPNKPVVALNIFPGDGYWSGDLILLMSNTFDYFDSQSRWVMTETKNVVVPAGQSKSFNMAFDTENLEAGDYSAMLTLDHNAPVETNPMEIPIALTVHAKNCLEALPAVVDFGKVWKDQDSVGKVTLKNPCNLPTVVQSMNIASSYFSTSASLPLEILPFSELNVEMTYHANDLSPDVGTLIIRSDAKNNPTFSVSLKGTGIRPPAISIKPSTLSVTLDPGATTRKTITLSNSGGDSLRIKVKALDLDGESKSAGIPKLIAGTPSHSRFQIGTSHASLPHASGREFKSSSGSPFKVLFLQVLFLPPEGNDFTTALRELANVASLDIVDVSSETPNLAYLEQYDIVLIGLDGTPADPVGLGNTLADYVDLGGKLVLTGSAAHPEPEWALSGRIATPEYMPITPGYITSGGTSQSLQDHPINAGVESIFSEYAIESFDVQGAGIPLGTYESGILTGAYHSSLPIVALNFYPIEGYWGGDIILMVGNTFDYLGSGARWMRPAVRNITVAPGKSFSLPIQFNSERLAAGSYQGILNFEHNSPLVDSPVEIPVTLQVRGKRCLALDTNALDFGTLWKGDIATLSLDLVNECNEPTDVTSVRVGDGSFTLVEALPLSVEAYSRATVQLAFIPKDSKKHSSKMEIRSNAQDNASLYVSVKGLSIEPPQISVTPAAFDESAKAGEIKRRTLIISNKGGDSLRIRINASNVIGTGVRGSASPTLVKASERPQGEPYFKEGAVFSYRHLDTLAGPNQLGFKILYITTILPDSGFTDSFVQGLRGLSNVAQLDLLNAEAVTPNLEYLQGYDHVIVASNFPWADPVQLGDVLADYVDRGGRLCLMPGAITNSKTVGLGGRIATETYMPMVMQSLTKGGPVKAFVDHPINAGIKTLYSLSPSSSSQVQGEGRPLGYLDRGQLLGAWHINLPIVALNVYPSNSGWKGDLLPMMENIFNYLALTGTWLSSEPRILHVAPGKTAEAIVAMDATQIRAGIYQAQLSLYHNVLAKEPVIVPVKLTVDGHLELATSSKTLEFGDVLIDSAKTLALKVTNAGNLPLTLTSATFDRTAYSLKVNPLPVNLVPGDFIELEIVYTPTQGNVDSSTLSLNAEGIAPVLIGLSGKGMRPAQIYASTAPSPLRFTVNLGGQTIGKLNLANLGDEALKYGIKVNYGADAIKLAASPVMAMGPEHYVTLLKGAADLRVGSPVISSMGGPDLFGYRWFDSNEIGGPAYNWIDISTSGRHLDKVSSCDDCSEIASLSFAFPFYGGNFTSINVSSNGYLTLGAAGQSFSNQPIPSKTMPGNLIAALFKDLYPVSGGSIYFQDFGNKAIVQYKSISDYQGSGKFDFEIILFADGTVDFQYQKLTGNNDLTTVGIQNQSGEDGLQVVYNADYLRNTMTVRIRTWLGIPEQIGGLVGSQSKSLNLSVDSRGMAVGAYPGKISINGMSLSKVQTLEVTVELIVTPPEE